MRIYKQYVRPHLEFSTKAWSPWGGADKARLKKIQQQAVLWIRNYFSDPDPTFQDIPDPDPTQLLSKEVKAKF